MTRVGNQTNSTDLHSINSRIFVGNLNTYLIAKEELENIFQRYGRIRGISMHKGYAFVQFTDTWDARNAVMGEDGRTVAGQVIDVNMVLEPKPHQIERKRNNTQSSTPLSNYLFARQVMPPLKRSKTDLMGFPSKPKIVKMDRITQPIFQSTINLSDDSDILICGNCKELFTCLQKFFEHKQRQCKLRFLCKCHQNGTVLDDPKQVHCFHCQIKCSTWWELVQHVQGNHGISIYRQIGEDMNTKSNAFKNGSQMTILSGSTSESSADAGKETNSCCSDTHSGLVENEWEVTQEVQNAHEDLLAQISQNHEKGVDTADLQEIALQG